MYVSLVHFYIESFEENVLKMNWSTLVYWLKMYSISPKNMY